MADGSSVRYRWHFLNNRYACCSFRGSRLSATPRAAQLWRILAKSNATNPLGRGLIARAARVARGERTKHKHPTDFRQPHIRSRPQKNQQATAVRRRWMCHTRTVLPAGGGAGRQFF